MSRFPWKNSSEEMASEVPSQWETPAGAQEKADKAEENAKEYSDDRLAEHVGKGGDAHALAVPNGEAGFISGEDQAKIEGIEDGAQRNQNAFGRINGVPADSQEDEFSIEGGIGIIVSTNPISKKATITATSEAIPGPHGIAHTEFGADPVPNATVDEGGLMSAVDKQSHDMMVVEVPLLAAGLDDLAGAGRTDETVKGNADALTAHLADTTQKFGEVNGDISDLQVNKANQSDLNATNSIVALKADKSYVDTQIASVASGSPKGVYATLAALQSAFPTGNSNIYIVTADGKWYFWSGSAWTAGGVYQSTGILDGDVSRVKLSDGVKDELSDLRKRDYDKTDYPVTISQLLTELDTVGGAGGAFTPDYVHKLPNKPFGWKKTIASAMTSEITSTFSPPKDISRTAALNMWVYLDDPEKIDHLQLHLNVNNVSATWSRNLNSLNYPIRKGWNLLRWPAHEGNILDWELCYSVRVVAVTNGPTTWTLGSISLERPNKAQIMFIQDGGYETFYDIGYPDLKQRDIHTTWALTPGRLGDGTVISEETLDEVALDSLSEFTFHSWASEIHSTMTSREIADNAIKCMRWLKKKGLQPRYWYRGAITQNNAPNHAILQDYLEAYASATGGSAGLNVFPLIQPYGFPRVGLHGATQANLDNWFTIMKKTRCLMICYTHGIGTGLPNDMTQENWDYFLSKIDTGLSEGWLESVTYSILRSRYERQFRGYGFGHLLTAMEK